MANNTKSAVKKKFWKNGEDFMGDETFNDNVDPAEMINKFMEMQLEEQAQPADAKRA